MNFFDRIFNSKPFKVIFPVNALAQGVTKAVTGMQPSAQYTTGASVGSGLAALRGLGALGAASGSSGMTPYLPTSTPNIEMAGLTSGPGGAFSSLNPMGSAGVGGTTGSSPAISRALSLMRMLPSGNQQPSQNPAMQRQQQEMQLRLIYQMFPNLKPGNPLGGMYGQP